MVTVIVRGGLLRLVSLGWSGIRGSALVVANLSLTFPVSLVKDLHLVLEGNQRLRLSNPGAPYRTAGRGLCCSSWCTAHSN